MPKLLNKYVEIKDNSGSLFKDGYEYNVNRRTGVKTAVWAWKEDSSRVNHYNATEILPNYFIKYDREVSAEIESYYQKWKSGDGSEIVDIDLNGKSKKAKNAHTGLQYQINFRRMVQINKSSRYERGLLRQDGPNGAPTCTLPRLPDKDFTLVLSNYLPTSKGQVFLVKGTRKNGAWLHGVLVSAQSSHPPATATEGWFPSVLCKTLSKDAASKFLSSSEVGTMDDNSSAVPRTWTNGITGLVSVQKRSTEWSDVHRYFVNNMNQSATVTVLRIERIQDRDKWDMYQAMKNVILRKYHSQSTLHQNSTGNLERPKLFHGTDAATVSKILKQGFNRSFSGRHGSYSGKGVYFATSPQTSFNYASPDSSGTRKMFLCRVIVGDFCQGKSGQVVPDTKPGTNDELFDTTVNDVYNPTIFVTYHDAQVYPEYLISFK